MKEIRNVSCSEICRDGSCTYPIPAGVRTDKHCDHAWMAEDGMVLALGRKNLILPDCRKEIHFVTRCDDTAVDHSVTYRGFNTTQAPITTVEPSGISIWLLVLTAVILISIGLFIMYRRKMFCFKRANGPNRNGVKTDHRNGGEKIPMM